MSIKESTHKYRLSQWLPIIKECRSSGMQVKEWCRQNNIDQRKFYYWQRRTRRADALRVRCQAPYNSDTIHLLPH